ncbi:MAG: TPM domain-containing protein [Hominenteromicrobium sp.]
MERKRISRVCFLVLALLLLIPLAAPAFASAIPDAPEAYVYDGADVLTASTENYINSQNAALDEKCGAQIVFVTVDFTGGYDIDDYAYELFNKWGIGDKKENNGLLFVLSIGAEDYYALPGSGIADVFTGGKLDALLYDYLETDFAAGNYDAGVRKTFDRALEMMQAHYNIASNAGYSGYEEARNEGGSVFEGIFRVIGKLITLVVIIAVVIILIRLFSGPRGGGGNGGGGGSGFWNGLLLGSLMNNRRRYYRRPPPPPPPHGGFGGPRPPRSGGGFGGGNPGGFGSGRSGGGFGGGGSFGGFGGGGSRGGGAGRR